MNIPHLSGRANMLVCFLMAAAASYFFITNVTSYYFLCDDAYISFRYARHLAEGLGLVWNPGEAVEGYTNFLWVLLMSASIRLDILPEYAANTLSICSAVLLLFILMRSFANLHGLNNPWTWLPLLVLSLSASFTAWSTSGLETMLFALLVFSGFLTFVHERETTAELPILSALLLAGATLTRPDGGVFMVVAGLYYLFDIAAKKRSFRSGLIWCAPYIAIVGAHLLWRYSYYGFWLPNTFYAKVLGGGLAQGLKYIGLFETSYQLKWFIPFAFVPAMLRRNYTSCLFLGIILTYLAYILYVGGDIFEFRFMVIIFPYLYWLIADGMALVFTATYFGGSFRHVTKFVAVTAAVGLIWTTHYASINPIPYSNRASNNTLGNIKIYADSRAAQGKFIRSLIDEGILPQDIVLGVGGAGAVPYYTKLPTVDRRGLNDVYIAHLPATGKGRAGHQRHAPYDYLVEKNVAIFDLYNQLVFPELEMMQDMKKRYDEREMRVRAVEVKNQYLIFGTFVSDEVLGNIFGNLPIISVYTPAD
jgi:arabinofuranosyltransferase